MGLVSSKERDESRVTLDIVIPLYNEEESIGILFERLGAVFSKAEMKKSRIKSVRYIMIDDGSTDKTAELIRDYIEGGENAVLYRFSRNFGHQNGVTAGMANADADLVAIIDADLQDPPEVIHEMVEAWRRGYDVVSGERKKRKENFFKVACYWGFYRLLTFLSEVELPLDSGDFCLLDRRVVETMRDLPEKLRFPRGLRAWVGFRQTTVSYERPARQAGTTKYSYGKLYKLATDGIAALSIRPLKVAQVFSLGFSIITLFIMAMIVVALFVSKKEDSFSMEFLLICLLVALGSWVQTFCMYVLGAYIGRSYLEIKSRPSYIVMEVIGSKDFPSTRGKGSEK